MLLTDHLAPGVAADLEAKGIAYVDAAGNAYLNGPAASLLIREHPGAPSTQPNSSPACASIVRTNRPLGRLTPPASRQVPEYGE